MKKMLKRLENEVEENVVEEGEKENISENEFMNLLMEDINHKTLSIVGGIDEKMVAYVREFANALWYYQDDDYRPLYVHLSTHGGYASSLLAILDILQDLKDQWNCTIITNCSGYAESCGFIIWCFGDERYMGNFGELMCHELAYSWDDKVSQHDKELKRIKRMQDKIDNIIMMKTPLIKQQLRKWYKEGDKFIDKEEAMKLGLLTVEEENK